MILAGERVPTSSPRRASGSLHLGTVGIEGVLRLNTRSDLRLSGHHSDAHVDRSDGGGHELLAVSGNPLRSDGMPRVRRLLATGIAVQAGAERIVSIYDRGRQAPDLDLVVKQPSATLARPLDSALPESAVVHRARHSGLCDGVDDADADAVTHSRSRPRIVTLQDRENGNDLVA